MFLRHVLTRASQRATDPTTDPAGACACRATPSLLEELADDPEDFADLARVLKVDVADLVATMVAKRPATAEELVARLRERRIVTPAPSAPAASPGPTDDLLGRVRALCAAVAAAITSTGRPRPITSWGGEGGRGWGRWARARGDVRAHRRGPDRTAEPTAPAALAAP